MMPTLFASQYNQPWRGLPLELREQIYLYLLCPIGGIKLVPYIHRDGLPDKKPEHPEKLYIEEQRFSYNDSQSYNYDRHHVTGRGDTSIDQDGYSDYDRGLAKHPFDRVAPKRSQELHLNIFLANKQAHQEATSCFYSRNVWHFDTRCDRILYFLQWLDPTYRCLIRDLRVTSEATLRHKGNLPRKDFTAFLADQMKLNSVTLAVPQPYHKESFFYRMGELRYIPDLFSNLTRAVWDGKLKSLRIHYDHLDAEPESTRLQRLGPVADMYKLYEDLYKDHFVYLLGTQYPDCMLEYQSHTTARMELNPKPASGAERFASMVERHRALYPFSVSLQKPQKDHDEVNCVVEMRVDIAASKAELAKLENLVGSKQGEDIEAEEAEVLGSEPPSLQSRFVSLRDSGTKFEMSRTAEAWRGERGCPPPARMMVKRARSSYA